nr:unnamed protein product [Naegleria fowleri]
MMVLFEYENYVCELKTTKWVPDIRHRCPNVPIVLAGTKSDLRKEKDYIQREGLKLVSPEEGQHYKHVRSNDHDHTLS